MESYTLLEHVWLYTNPIYNLILVPFDIRHYFHLKGNKRDIPEPLELLLSICSVSPSSVLSPPSFLWVHHLFCESAIHSMGPPSVLWVCHPFCEYTLCSLSPPSALSFHHPLFVHYPFCESPTHSVSPPSIVWVHYAFCESTSPLPLSNGVLRFREEHFILILPVSAA